MLKHLIILPDKTELFSGAGTKNAIMGVKLTDSVNADDELTLGSAFANIMEASVITPAAGLSVAAGDEVTLYKIDDAGNRIKKGIYTMEKPTRPTANTLKLTGYDRVIKLDKDLTAWLQDLDGWPYRLIDFASMVCEACGLTLATNSIPNKDFPVNQFVKAGVTGRQLMRWIGEICCRFCRANADGEIEFAWYEPSGKTITPGGSTRYFANSLTYDTYEVAKVDAVQLRLAESSDGALWPNKEASNPYVISGNPILLAKVTEDLIPYLKVIENEMADFTYTPCKVSIPSTLDIKAGQTVDITDANGKTIKVLVMTKTTSGQRDTLACTGSPKRDSSSAMNNKTAAQIAQDQVSNQTQEDIFNKLTRNGQLKGLYMKDGELYINASYILTGELLASLLKTGKIVSEDGTVVLDLSNNKVTVYSKDKTQRTEIQAGVISQYQTDENGNEYNTLTIDAGASFSATEIRNEEGTGGIIVDGMAGPTTIGGVGLTQINGDEGINIGSGGPVGVIGSGLTLQAIGGDLKIGGKVVSWRDNGDGTFTMTGQ
jgi:hypothetical protein